MMVMKKKWTSGLIMSPRMHALSAIISRGIGNSVWGNQDRNSQGI